MITQILRVLLRVSKKWMREKNFRKANGWTIGARSYIHSSPFIRRRPLHSGGPHENAGGNVATEQTISRRHLARPDRCGDFGKRHGRAGPAGPFRPERGAAGVPAVAGPADGDIPRAGQQWGGVSGLFAGVAPVRQGANEVWKVRV